MTQLIVTTIKNGEEHALRAMFEARREVFIDLLKWDLAPLAGRYEVDQFDNEHARYLILLDDAGRHLGSARLLETVRPHILDSVFPQICVDGPPRGPRIQEITRFCLDRRLRAAERRQVRNMLVTAIVNEALDQGITHFTGIAEMGWLQQILAFGWDCAPLGLPFMHAGKLIGAMLIHIAADTPARLSAAGIWSPIASDFDATRIAGGQA